MVIGIALVIIVFSIIGCIGIKTSAVRGLLGIVIVINLSIVVLDNM